METHTLIILSSAPKLHCSQRDLLFFLYRPSFLCQFSFLSPFVSECTQTTRQPMWTMITHSQLTSMPDVYCFLFFPKKMIKNDILHINTVCVLFPLFSKQKKEETIHIWYWCAGYHLFSYFFGSFSTITGSQLTPCTSIPLVYCFLFFFLVFKCTKTTQQPTWSRAVDSSLSHQCHLHHCIVSSFICIIVLFPHFFFFGSLSAPKLRGIQRDLRSCAVDWSPARQYHLQ